MVKVETDRSQSLDILRFVAAFGIVLAHALNPRPIAAIGYAALAFFLMMMSYLSVRHVERRQTREKPFTDILRLRRIILPWVFWSIFYKALIALQMRDPQELFRLNEVNWLLVGSTIHLWFLPFILLASTLLVPLARRIRSVGELWLACAAATALSAVCLYLHDWSMLITPFGQWSFAIAPFLYGLLAAVGEKVDAPWPPALFLIAISVGFAIFSDGYWPPFYLLAMAVLQFALATNIRNAAFKPLGSLAFGIYLIHPLMLFVWYYLVGGDRYEVYGLVFAFAMSAVSTALMKQMPLLKEVV